MSDLDFAPATRFQLVADSLGFRDLSLRQGSKMLDAAHVLLHDYANSKLPVPVAWSGYATAVIEWLTIGGPEEWDALELAQVSVREITAEETRRLLLDYASVED